MRAHWTSTLSLVVALCVGALPGWAETLQHRGELTDLDGQAVADGAYPMSFSLWSEAQGGELLWEEDHPAVEVRSGGFAVELGGLVPIEGDLTVAWLETTVAGDLLQPRTKVDTNRADCTVDGNLTASALNIASPVIYYSSLWMPNSDLFLSNYSAGAIRLSTSTNTGQASARMQILNSGEVHIGPYPYEPFTGKLKVGGRTYLEDGTDASLADASGYLVVGTEDAANVVIDENEIMARNNGATSILYLQNSGGDVYVNGSLVHSSDARLKKGVADLEPGLDEVLALRPVSFEWANRDDGRRLGLVAQEVRGVVDEVVYEGQDGMLGIAYESLIPVLVKAIQEQQAEIEALSCEVAELRQAPVGQ